MTAVDGRLVGARYHGRRRDPRRGLLARIVATIGALLLGALLFGLAVCVLIVAAFVGATL
jgi:hypothetical protein